MKIDNFFWLLESRILEVEEKKFPFLILQGWYGFIFRINPFFEEFSRLQTSKSFSFPFFVELYDCIFCATTLKMFHFCYLQNVSVQYFGKILYSEEKQLLHALTIVDVNSEHFAW